MTTLKPMRTRVKICGITRPEDAIAAAEAGADAIGLVFFAKSPRAVDIGQAAEVMAALPPFVTSVGLFVNPEARFVADVLDGVGLDLLQFHGDESAGFCAGFNRPYIKAIRMAPDVDLCIKSAEYSTAQGLLLDSYEKGIAGGTGQTFDWARIPDGLDKPVILAGGLNPDNVEQAIGTVVPWAVDVSSGVEQDKGIKSREKIRAFLRGVERANPA